MRRLVILFVVLAQVASVSAQGKSRNADNALARARGTYEGTLNQYESPIRVVVDDSRPNDCGLAELSAWGCSGPIVNCRPTGQGLAFDMQLFEKDGSKCKRIAYPDALISHGLMGLQIELYTGGRVRLATAPQVTHSPKVGSLPAGPRVPGEAVPKCDPKAAVDLDLNGEWSYRERAGLVFVQQKGTCIEITVPGVRGPSYEAKGTLDGAKLLLRWREVGGRATGTAKMQARIDRLLVASAPGTARWLPPYLGRIRDLSALPLAKELLSSNRGAKQRAAIVAAGVLLGLDFEKGGLEDSAMDPRLRAVAAQAAKLQRALPRSSEEPGPLLVAAIELLIETGHEARKAGDRKRVLACMAAASTALRKLRDPKRALPLSVRIGSLNPDMPYVIRTAGLRSKAAERARSEAVGRCSEMIAKGDLGAAQTACDEADRMLAELAPEALELATVPVAAEDSKGLLARDQLKVHAALGESELLQTLSRRYRELVAVAGKPDRANIREQALAWAEQLLGQMVEQLGQGAAFHDLPTAMRALQTDLRVTMPTMPTSLEHLGAMSRQASYGSFFMAGESLEDQATGFAATFRRAPTLAFYLLSQRKGKGHAVEGIVSKLARRANDSDYAQLRLKRGQLSATYFAGLGETSSQPSGPPPLRTEIELIEGRLAIDAQKRATARTKKQERAEQAWLRTVASALPKDGALISYQRYSVESEGHRESHYAAFVVRGRAGEAELFPLDAAAPIDGAIEALVASVQRPGPLAEAEQRAAALYDLLFRPLAQRLPGVAKLWISPDAQITRVPFAALHDGQRWLIDRFELQAVEAAPCAARAGAVGATPSIVVLANPARGAAIYGHPSLDPQAYDDLAGAAAEAQLLESTFPGRVKALEGADAREAALYELRAPSILHIASHGAYLADAAGESPGASRGIKLTLGSVAPTSRIPGAALTREGMLGWLQATLLVASPASSRDAALVDGLDGFATAYELSTLDLHGTRLVVLSACQSGLGAIGGWSGVNSVQEAFHIAGAEDVVATLWNIGDEPTLAFMRVFYRAIADGAPVARALQRAIVERKRIDRHPYAWAPFVLSARSTQNY